MDTNTSCFDEQAHRAELADLRLWLDEEFFNLDLGRIPQDSKRVRLLKLLARAYDLYNGLVTQTIMEEMIDALARQENKRLRTEIGLLKQENAFLRKEEAYHKSALKQERAVNWAYFELTSKYLPNTQQEGGTSS
ncbi:hypothetical protein [Hymenobacter norwichensis]|uniref:hypothetical protein n=1 Tax=Hymenobacter norwichensis TaxID=223903 RepID=UPI0012F9F9D1|nr:hypothetical protein [Hymenobacter norwichensis]